jgi:RNA polymerase sigma factor (sigma-70 family)
VTAVEFVAIEHEASQHLRSALAELPEKHRAVVQLCWLEHTPSAAAAERLHCSTNAVKRRLRQAKQLLRARLERFPLWMS